MPVTINGTTGITSPDGSAGTPSLVGTDSNTGIFFPAADTIAFSEGGAEAMRIDSSGNVGIGMTPTNFGNGYTVLQVANASNGGMLYLTNTANAGGRIFGNAAGLNYESFSSTFHAFSTNGSERARILSTGQVLIDRTSSTNSGKLEIFADSDGTFNPLTVIQGAAGATSRNSVIFHRVSAGASVGAITTTNSVTAYVTSSDYRLKEAIAPMTGALAKVALLKPCTYKWKIDGSAGQGFIAHELDEVVPGCVTGEKDAVDKDGKPQYQGIDTSFLVATLTAAIQELKAIVDAQAARITALEGTP